MNLEAAATSLTEQFPAGQRDDLARREQMIERFGQFAFGGFAIVGLLAIASLIYVIITKLILSGVQPVAGAVLIAFVISAVMMLAYVFFREDLKDRRKKSRPQSPIGSSPIDLKKPVVTGKLLEEREFEPVPSVIENTTDLLPVGRAKDEA